jgi:hypothetical protein
VTTTIPAYANTGVSTATIGLKVQLASDASGSYVPVVVLDADGEISIGAVSQEGTWVINQGTGGSSAWKVDASAVTSPVSVASLPLPTGAATATNQAAMISDLGEIIGVLGTPFQAGGAVNQGTSPWIVQQSDNRAVNQTINSATLNAAVTVNLQGGEGEVGWTITGLTASGATVTFEGTNNVGAGSPVWAAINALAGSTISTTATADGNYRVEAGGRTAVRVRVSSVGTGTLTISYSASSASSLVSLAQSLPVGTNEIGFVGPSGSNGVDYSANAPSFSGLSLLATIPANTSRLGYFIQSQATTGLTVVMDDQAGSLTPTVVVLAGAASNGAQGGAVSMDGLPHSGRIRIYASSSGVQMAARAW